MLLILAVDTKQVTMAVPFSLNTFCSYCYQIKNVKKANTRRYLSEVRNFLKSSNVKSDQSPFKAQAYLADFELACIRTINTARKVSKYGVFSGPYFSVFGLNTGKYGPKKLRIWIFFTQWNQKLLVICLRYFLENLISYSNNFLLLWENQVLPNSPF